MFHYHTGENVLLGDVVQYFEWQGIVEFFLEGGTKDAADYGASHGGVMILSFSGGRFLLDSTEDEEDLTFLSRFNTSVPVRFAEHNQLCSLSYHDATPISVGDEIEYNAVLGGVAIPARVVEILHPFSASAWEKKIPTGGFRIEFADGQKMLLLQEGSSIRLQRKSMNS